MLFWRQSIIHPRFKSVAQKLVIQKYVGYDANNDYHQSVGYFAYDEAKVVNIVLKFKLRLLESQVKMILGFDYPFLPKGKSFKKNKDTL